MYQSLNKKTVGKFASPGFFQEVHGTICLVVSPEWSWEKDCENFIRGEPLQNPVSIANGDGTDSTRKLDLEKAHPKLKKT